ncbi:unnamed protein product [Bemisia tabaci]|uniref:Uncharacterized protein n=1 Tax=Bemisia tabaci TaxID=7038 RepID=A0A9P0ADJ1_BEMTA|nr:unnamed protein product [Bemisia tabaci]
MSCFAVVLFCLLLSRGMGTKMTYGSVCVDTGDVIKVSYFSCRQIFLPPYHAAFALNRHHIMHIGGRGGKLRPQIAFVRMFRNLWTKFPVEVLKPDPARKPVVEKGLIIAARMNRLFDALPFRRLTCNCRHYTDYFVYGKTFGSWKTFGEGYWPIDARCPLHREITNETDVTAPDFTLLDKYGKPYRLLSNWTNPIEDGARLDEVEKAKKRSKEKYERSIREYEEGLIKITTEV